MKRLCKLELVVGPVRVVLHQSDDWKEFADGLPPGLEEKFAAAYASARAVWLAPHPRQQRWVTVALTDEALARDDVQAKAGEVHPGLDYLAGSLGTSRATLDNANTKARNARKKYTVVRGVTFCKLDDYREVCEQLNIIARGEADETLRAEYKASKENQ